MAFKVRTAIFPVAGMGSRFLPITKSIPKEMLPIIDKPLIQFAVEEALEAGIEKMIFVTNSGKRAIEDYFDSNFELEARLKTQGNQRALALVQRILPEHVSFSYVRQKAPRGLGDAVLSARHLVGDEPFAVLLADDLMFGKPHAVLTQMVAAFSEREQGVLAVEEIAVEDSLKYGIVGFDATLRINTIVEKPKPQNAPSRYGVVGRYILMPTIFDYLAKLDVGVGGEVQLTDAIARQLEHDALYVHKFEGKRFDCGSPEGYIEAMLYHGWHQPTIRSTIQKFFQTIEHDN